MLFCNACWDITAMYSSVNYIWCPILGVLGGVTWYAFFGTSYNLPLTARDPAWWVDRDPTVYPESYSGVTAGFPVYYPTLNTLKSIFFGYREGDLTVPVLTTGTYTVESYNGQSYTGTMVACSHNIKQI